MDETNILTVLAQLGDGFSKRQRSVAQYICDNCEKAAFMTASMLSEAANVSESTVVRFAVQLGFENYPAMRRAMQQVLKGRLATIREMESVESGGSVRVILQKTLVESVQSLRNLENESNERGFESIIEAIQRCTRVYIIGTGNKAHLADYFAARLDLIRGSACAYGSDGFLRLENITRNDLLISLSTDKSCAAALMLAKDKGAETGLVFDGTAEPGTKYADYVISAGNDVTIMAFLEAIVTAASMAAGKAEETLRQETEKLLEEYEEYER